jgi:hypothetical protein
VLVLEVKKVKPLKTWTAIATNTHLKPSLVSAFKKSWNLMIDVSIFCIFLSWNLMIGLLIFCALQSCCFTICSMNIYIFVQFFFRFLYVSPKHVGRVIEVQQHLKRKCSNYCHNPFISLGVYISLV